LTHRPLFVAALAFCLSLIAAHADAQTSPAATPASSGASHSLTLSGSFGYLFAKTTGTGGDTAPAGWLVGLEGVFDGKIAGVVEFAGSYQSAHTYRTNLGGARFIFKHGTKAAPFVQVLAGVGRSSATGDEVNAFTLQPGVGVDLFGLRHVAVRLQGDYAWRHRDTGNVNGFRFAASIVIR